MIESGENFSARPSALELLIRQEGDPAARAALASLVDSLSSYFKTGLSVEDFAREIELLRERILTQKRQGFSTEDVADETIGSLEIRAEVEPFLDEYVGAVLNSVEQALTARPLERIQNLTKGNQKLEDFSNELFVFIERRILPAAEKKIKNGEEWPAISLFIRANIVLFFQRKGLAEQKGLGRAFTDYALERAKALTEKPAPSLGPELAPASPSTAHQMRDFLLEKFPGKKAELLKAFERLEPFVGFWAKEVSSGRQERGNIEAQMRNLLLINPDDSSEVRAEKKELGGNLLPLILRYLKKSLEEEVDRLRQTEDSSAEGENEEPQEEKEATTDDKKTITLRHTLQKAREVIKDLLEKLGRAFH